MAIGFLLLILGGVCQGSFGLGNKKYTPLSWESFWTVFMSFCALCAFFFAFLSPGFPEAYEAVGKRNLILGMSFGAFWGVTSVFFSLGIDKIGLSLLCGISAGVSNAVGSVVPLLVKGEMPDKKFLICLLISLALTISGISIIAKAGLMKEGSPSGKKNAIAGILMAALVGVGGACQNIGFTFLGKVQEVVSGFSAGLVQWFPVLLSGCVTSVIITVGMIIKRKSISDFSKDGAKRRVAILFGVSVVWYAALALYGISTHLIGENGAVTGWLIFNVLALIVSSTWGIVCGEWKGNKKALKVLIAGFCVLVMSLVSTAFMNNLA